MNNKMSDTDSGGPLGFITVCYTVWQSSHFYRYTMQTVSMYYGFQQQLMFAHGRWFIRGTLASSTTKIGRHNIAEGGIKHNKINLSIN
jgi:hypothetical protein